MSAPLMSAASLAIARDDFLAALPAMKNVIRFRVRTWPKRQRAEAVDDAIAACWHAWYGLSNRGADPRAVGPSGIAENAVRYVLNGRRLGCGTIRRSSMDVLNPKVQAKTGLRIFSLEEAESESHGVSVGSWREWLAENNRVSPGDEAAFRVDFDRWLSGLPDRRRKTAKLLTLGHETGEVARILGVTPAAVSQARSWLEKSWMVFQGLENVLTAPARRRGRGRPRKASRPQRRSLFGIA